MRAKRNLKPAPNAGIPGNMKGGKREHAGRPKAEIDWIKVGKLLQAQCKVTGIAGLLGISPDTLYKRCQEDNKIEFTVFCEQKKSEGVELLRAKQFEVAMKGNVPMNIWLGKQYLGQKDKNEVDVTSKGQRVSAPIDFSKLSEEAKKELYEAAKEE